jgi:hypothetical protein
MLSSQYVEDIFIEFYWHVTADKISVQWQDSTPISSFASVLLDGRELTRSQSDYILRILTKYKAKSKIAGLDYELLILEPKWKKTFRVIDHSKKVHVELSADNVLQICLKFPYDFKKTFDLEFSELLVSASGKSWDAERKVRVISVYDINMIKLHDFLDKHNFELDDSFLEIVALIEESWDQQDNLVPYSLIENGHVILKNAVEDTQLWWNEHQTFDTNQDMLMAKSMGYPIRLNKGPETDIEKISASTDHMFWLQNNFTFFELYKKIKTGYVCVILDRTSDVHEWIRNFVISSTQSGVDRADIKVCFRETDLNKKNRFNEWIKEQGLGGSVDTGRIFIFENKPAKWLFSKNLDVKLIVTNNLYPNTNNMTQQWIEHHPCVVYLGDIKPSQKRNTKIVQL